MALNIKNLEVEQLANQLARETGVSKTEVIRRALISHRAQLRLKSPEEKIRDYIDFLDRVHGPRRFPPVTKAEWDALNE